MAKTKDKSVRLTTIVVIHFGFTVVIGTALLLYFLAPLALWMPLQGI